MWMAAHLNTRVKHCDGSCCPHKCICVRLSFQNTAHVIWKYHGSKHELISYCSEKKHGLPAEQRREEPQIRHDHSVWPAKLEGKRESIKLLIICRSVISILYHVCFITLCARCSNVARSGPWPKRLGIRFFSNLGHF